MKKINSYILLFLLVSLLACKKGFLEITPKGKLIANTTNDYRLLLNNLDVVNMNTTGSVPMGDEVAAISSFFDGAALRTQRLFKWEAVIYEPGEDAPELVIPLSNIYLYNKIINEVMSSTGGTEQDKKTVLAQAKACRAWTYFLLINYYGKPYNTATSLTDPGFPLVTNADVTETQFNRATVEEVYQLIVNDLTTAIPDLPAMITHRLMMSHPSAEGILGKVYTFMGKYQEAVPLLNNALSKMSAAAISVALYNYNSTFGTGGIFLPISIFGPTYPTTVNNTENLFVKQFSNSWAFTNNEFVISPETVALYEAADLRKNWYTASPYGATTVYPKALLRRMGPGTTQFGVIAPDLYLLIAECKARTNDLAGARTFLETFRANRLPAANAKITDAVALNRTALVKFIFEERLREFALTGYRWFDMRRLSVDTEFSALAGNTHTVYSAAGDVITTYTLSKERLVLQLPQKLMEQNPGMVNNP